jgi:predicted nucleotidyltransferase
MPRIEPVLLPVVTDLARGLRELGVPFGVVGALVPELLLDARPTRMTNDADVTVVVESLAEFETLKDRLGAFGFARTLTPHRLQHHSGGLVDLLPFSESIAPGGHLKLQEDFALNMAGFAYVIPHAVATTVEGGPTLPLAPLPLYALLKLVAFDDRKAAKDLAGVFHCLHHYLEDDERRYGAEHDGAGVPYEYTGAYLLGVDGQPFLDVQLASVVARVLDRFSDPDADVIGVIARQRGRVAIEDDDRIEVFEHFRWYRVGTGV